MSLALAFLGISLLAGLAVLLLHPDGILPHLLGNLKNRNDRGKFKKESSKHVI